MAYFVQVTLADGMGAELNIEHISSIERPSGSDCVTVRMQNDKYYIIKGVQVAPLDHAISRINDDLERRLQQSETVEE